MSRPVSILAAAGALGLALAACGSSSRSAATPTTEHVQVCTLAALAHAEGPGDYPLTDSSDPFDCFQGWGVAVAEQPVAPQGATTLGIDVFRNQGYGWTEAGEIARGDICAFEGQGVPVYVVQQWVHDLRIDGDDCG